MTDNPRVEKLLEELLDSDATPEEVCGECPELLPEVRTGWQRLRALKAEVGALFPESTSLNGTAPDGVTPPTSEMPRIDGYEVQAILGHGGMGVVYKAWHLQLNRPVALKMLLVGRYARPEELERFFREAEAVAGLRHANIVQVYDVGDLEARPYFTMEFIEGGSLAQKLAGVPQPAALAAALVETLARAVHHAHQSGIIHRDLKPANILLTSDGTPKITDFGLARRLEDGAALTLSGAPVGTPSYMAPEQAQGQRDAIGPVTDVYALGVILYEMLTGRPPFRAETSAGTVQQVLADDPVPPARLNPQVPRDLGTICLKCLHKEPHKRYASAQALADDLGRFGRGEPIMARPLGRLGRLGQWARKRPTAAAVAAALLATVLLVLALVGGGLWLSGQWSAAEQDLGEANQLLRRSDLAGAQAALERARGRLGAGGWSSLHEQLTMAERTLKLLQTLDAIRMHRCVIFTRLVDRRDSDRAYEEAFGSEGPGTPRDDAAAVADRLAQSPARAALVAALDDWAICAADHERRGWLLQVARLADPDPWGDRVRDPAAWHDGAKLADFTRTVPMERVSVQLLLALGERLHAAGGDEVGFLWKVQQKHPSDFYANYYLGVALLKEEPGVAIGFFRTAHALRPHAATANFSLGYALADQGRMDEALVYFKRAIDIDPQDSLSRTHFALALMDKGRIDDAISEFREVLRLDPQSTYARNELGIALEKKGRPDEAIRQYEETLAVDPRSFFAHANLASLLAKRRENAKAVEHYRAAVAADPESAKAHTGLGFVLKDMGRLDEATDHLRKAVALTPGDTVAQNGLRDALIRRGRLEEARAAWRKALDAGPGEHGAWFGYAELCLFLGNEEEYRRNRRALLVRFGGSKDRSVAERTGRACLLLPGTKDEMEDAAALTDRAMAGGVTKGQEWAYPYFVFAKGLAEYRLDRLDSAIKVMEGEPSKLKGPTPRLVLAMALYRNGQKDKARKTLAAAIGSFDWSTAKADNHDPWIAHVLRREAEALILPKLPAK